MEENKTPKIKSDEKITRKEAFQKAGKYAAFSAVTMMMLMSPTESSAQNASQRDIQRPKRH